MSLARFLNTVWMLKCEGEARAFRRATRHVTAAQAAILRDILRRNQDTEFGRAHGFAAIRDARTYQERVPLSRYEDYAGAIECIAAGQQRVLTGERVLLLEPTSGTTGGEKLIPYTESLRRQFQRAVAVWIADLFRKHPAVRCGRAYWSISPALAPPRQTAGGVPIGFADDAAYLGTLEQFALERLLVVPSVVSHVIDMDAFRYCTLRYLLGAEDLTLISIWNPTFLPALLAPLERWAERLCRDLYDGALRPPSPLPSALAGRLARGGRARKRAAVLMNLLSSSLPLAEKLHRIWPRLALISCWADAAAESCLPKLRELFPYVEIQPKGLLATEGCVTVPLVRQIAPALAVRSHFFEFQEADETEKQAKCRLAQELEVGGHYRVILTTGGGLYRYQQRDEVRVMGFLHQCPLLRFLGKVDRVSDRVGEKLAEPHVRGVLDRAFAAVGIVPRFALLAPIADQPARYRLFVHADGTLPDLAPALQAEVEEGLRENLYYRHAVSFGQLAPVQIEWLCDGELAWRIYERRCLALGQKVGAIKPAALDSWTGWGEAFRSLHFGPPLVQRS